jgi:hypothetical protein
LDEFGDELFHTAGLVSVASTVRMSTDCWRREKKVPISMSHHVVFQEFYQHLNWTPHPTPHLKVKEFETDLLESFGISVQVL